MKRRDLLSIAAASAAGLLLPSWLTAAPARKILVPGFTPPAFAAPERKATLTEVQALIRRWQRGKDEYGNPLLAKRLRDNPVTLADLALLDTPLAPRGVDSEGIDYEEYLFNRDGRPPDPVGPRVTWAPLQAGGFVRLT